MLSPLLNRWMSDRQGRADKLCPSFMSALPQKQTLADVNRMSSKCQKRKFAGRGSTLPQRTKFNLTQPPLRKERVRAGCRGQGVVTQRRSAIAYAGGEPYFSSATIAFCSSVRMRCAELTLTMVGSR